MVPDKVVELVERFRKNEAIVRSPDYQEAKICQDFIEPLFATLGWNFCHEQNLSKLYKEVIFGEAIKSRGWTEAPDYCFQVESDRKFFVKVKKPFANLVERTKAAFQIRRYGWSAKLPVSILTNFEEFAVYDCRIIPNQTDQLTTARSLYLKYTEYIHRWEEIYSLFSRQAVLAGSLEQYPGATKLQRRTAVDTTFLKEIEIWRAQLAVALVSKNSDLEQQQLNFVVQKTINRLIFLRICEARGIEPDGQLRSLIQHNQIYPQLCHLFQVAADRYDAQLFCFQSEKDKPQFDDFTWSLIIPDQPLQQIIQNLYYPTSPYEFSVMPIEILGQVYEQFLGKVIRLTSDNKVIVENKPEVRKAGGVYYTPPYLVDYIVKHTVGQLLVGKTLQQAEKVCVLDPACGAGSFLIGAYRFLLDWYLQQYLTNPEKYKHQLYQTIAGDWRLNFDEKKQILLNHIYGVDIDLQAVETTKLSLLLKVLEGESQETIAQDVSPLQERKLPDLTQNIKCGNALIGSDYDSNSRMHCFNEGEQHQINGFDWKKEFPEIMRAGGFDVVIGNPPWVFTRDAEFGEDIKKYYQRKYFTDIVTSQKGKAKQTGKVNLFTLFLIEFIKLTNKNGLTGIILPNTILRTTVYDVARKYVLDHCNIERIVELGSGAFERVTASTVILVLGKNLNNNEVKFVQASGTDFGMNKMTNFSILDKNDFLENTSYVFSVFLTDRQRQLFEKLDSVSTKLSCITREIIEGIVCKREQVLDRAIDDRCKRLLEGKDINRYSITFRQKYIVFDRKKIHRPRPDFVWAATEKIILRRIGGGNFSLIASLDTKNYYAFASTNNILLRENCLYDIRFVLGLLNSRLLNYYYAQKFTNQSELTVNISKTFIEQLPIRIIDFNCQFEHLQHDRIVQLVKHILSLHQQLVEARMPQKKSRIQTQIDITDRQIDQLVYELYGLTEEEIAMVESRQK